MERSEPARTLDRPLEALVELGGLDAIVDQLRHRRAQLPERGSLEVLEARLRATTARLGEIETSLAARIARQLELDARAASIGQRVREIESRAGAPDAPSFRDQEAMAGEVASLAERKAGIEDEELAEMEAAELLEAELAAGGVELAELRDVVAEAREGLRAAEEAIDAELLALETVRFGLASDAEPSLLGEYERIRARLGGSGIAHLVHGTCSGCHLSLPAAELDRIRHLPPGTVAHCDQCGRLLFA